MPPGWRSLKHLSTASASILARIPDSLSPNFPNAARCTCHAAGLALLGNRLAYLLRQHITFCPITVSIMIVCATQLTCRRAAGLSLVEAFLGGCQRSDHGALAVAACAVRRVRRLRRRHLPRRFLPRPLLCQACSNVPRPIEGHQCSLEHHWKERRPNSSCSIWCCKSGRAWHMAVTGPDANLQVRQMFRFSLEEAPHLPARRRPRPRAAPTETPRRYFRAAAARRPAPQRPAAPRPPRWSGTHRLHASMHAESAGRKRRAFME